MPRKDDDPRLNLRRAVVGIPAMLCVALASENDSRELALRVGHIVRQLHSDVLEEFGEREAEDMVGASLRLVHDRVTDIFGPDAWNELRAAEPPRCASNGCAGRLPPVRRVSG
jgi:hypothetical protein